MSALDAVPNDLPPSRNHVFLTLTQQAAPATPGDLSDATGLSVRTVLDALDDLEAEGLVEPAPVPDARKRAVTVVE